MPALRTNQRYAWVREYKYNRGTYDHRRHGSSTTRLRHAKLFATKAEARKGSMSYAVPKRVIVTVSEFDPYGGSHDDAG